MNCFGIIVTWGFKGSAIVNDVSPKLVPSTLVTVKARASNTMFSVWSRITSFRAKLSTALINLQNTIYLHSIFQVWPCQTVLNACVTHVSHRLDEAPRESVELFRKLLMTDSTVRPRSRVILGAERIFSSWLTSWFTWDEFRDATFCVWFKRSLATLSGLLVVASKKWTN